MRRKKQKLPVCVRVFVIFAAGFLLSGSLLVRDLCRSARERAANEMLIERVEQETPGSQPAVPGSALVEKAGQEESVSSQAAEPERDYRPLVQENSHLAAWITIEGTEVDYPVMYTPEDPEYYLRRAFDGSYALSGSLFIGADCTPDGSNVIVYGHKMEDGSMFGSLASYADADYAREHPYIVYDRIRPDGSYERLTFEVMAAFYSRIYKVNEENVFRYYYGTDLSDPEDFRYYVQETMAASLYDLGVTAEYGDRLLTLLTCSYHTQDGRFVVVARQCPQ